uniref:Uncharacterized protein n=1 Tax=Anguilla anguilla TaxID=7936 RepID=A0A0E9QNP9_ANGAN
MHAKIYVSHYATAHIEYPLSKVQNSCQEYQNKKENIQIFVSALFPWKNFSMKGFSHESDAMKERAGHFK